MEKRRWDGTTIGTYWSWEMPEIAQELPELFQAAGRVTEVREGMIPIYIAVTIQLHTPAKVVNWDEKWGDGVAINSSTGSCFAEKFSVTVYRLPKDGDTVIELFCTLSIDTFKEEEEATLDDLREAIRKFAEKMTKTWYYNFR